MHKILSRITLAILFALAIAMPHATEASAAAGRRPFSIQGEPPLDFADYMLPVEDYTLSNGMRVLLARDDSAPVVAVNLTYRVGGANDPEGRSGFAHLFEHMMFYGSANVKQGEFDTYLTQIGARFNAYTADDKTVYYTTAPANELPLILWLESDRLASLVIDQKAFETERNVVIEEYNQRVANAPYGYAFRRFDVLPFQGYAPYERPTIGSVADLNAATLEDVQYFFDTYYVPNNVTLAIVGDIDIEQTKLLVDAYFGGIPSGNPPAAILERAPLPAQFPTLRTEEDNGCQIGYEETIIDPLAELPVVLTSVVTTDAHAADYYALALLGNILGTGDSSRFEQNIVQQGKAAFTFASFNQNRLGAGVMQFGIYLQPTPEGSPDLDGAYALLRAELESVRTSGVSEEELGRAKQQILLDAISSFRSDVGTTAEWLQDYALRFDDPTLISQIIARYDEVTTADVQRVAQTYLCDRPLNVIKVLQEGEPASTAEVSPLVEAPAPPPNPLDALPPGVVSRRSAPAALPASELTIPQFITFTLDNELEVIFVEEHKTPKIDARLYIAGANTALPPTKQGVAGLLAGVITKGTTTRNAVEIAAAIEGVGGTLSGRAFNEFTGIFASGPSTSTDLLFDLLADVTLNPTFPQDQFNLVRDQTLADMEFDASLPNTLATRQFNRIAYPDHPYSFYPTPDTVREITPEDLVAFHQDYYKPNNALLIIVGDLTEETARAQTERVFATWQPEEVPPLFDYPPLQQNGSRDPEGSQSATHIEGEPLVHSYIYLIDRPDAEQSTVRVGNLALDARNDDRYALSLVNTVLGGSGLASRLNRNLREDKGYTYGVSSGLTTQNDTGVFLVAGDVGTAVTGDALKEILYELNRIRETGVLTNELSEAKGMRIGQFTMSIADPASLSSELAVRRLYGLPLAEIESYVSSIEQVTASEVLSAARQYIDVQTPIIVVVGDAAQVKPQLQMLGTVAVVDADGNVIEVVEAVAPPDTSAPVEGEEAASNCVCPEDATSEADNEGTDK